MWLTISWSGLGKVINKWLKAGMKSTFIAVIFPNGVMFLFCSIIFVKYVLKLMPKSLNVCLPHRSFHLVFFIEEVSIFFEPSIQVVSSQS